MTEFILYLQPQDGTSFSDALKEFFWQTRNVINEAAQFPPHISLTGFFCPLISDKNHIISVLEQTLASTCISQLPSIGPPVISGDGKVLFVPIACTDPLLEWLQAVKAALVANGVVNAIEKKNASDFRIKRADHLSLYYYGHRLQDDPPQVDLDSLFGIAEELLCKTSCDKWRIALHERTIAGDDAQQPHIFVEHWNRNL